MVWTCAVERQRVYLGKDIRGTAARKKTTRQAKEDAVRGDMVAFGQRTQKTEIGGGG